MLYLFPPEVPMTRSKILKSIETCNRFSTVQTGPIFYHTEIRYFSCVPYVLKMLLENDEATSIQFLKGLDMLGVGGAPLPKDLGDKLVDKGVHLISRFGSAECGFLMSSVRDFERDREWQYLRSEGSGGALVFEPQEEEGEEVAELVIQSKWPCMVSYKFFSGCFCGKEMTTLCRRRLIDRMGPSLPVIYMSSIPPFRMRGSISVGKMIW
jgi:hypothetical protein